jgi:hypothetical protein
MGIESSVTPCANNPAKTNAAIIGVAAAQADPSLTVETRCFTASLRCILAVFDVCLWNATDPM